MTQAQRVARCRGGSRDNRLGAPAPAAVLAVLALLSCSAARAQTQSWVPGKGHGSASVAYQDLFIGAHSASDGTRTFPGTVTNHSVFFTFDYGLTDRLALSIGLPFKANKFGGPSPHDPATLYDDHGERSVDDGRYHAGWQDWNVGLRYLWRDGTLKVTPFASFGYPSHDYVTFAHSALGSHQLRLQLGVNIGRQFAPPLQNLYFQGGYSYSIMEEVEAPRRVNHSSFNVELGYFLTPRLTVSALVAAQKTHNGFDFPEDYPDRLDDHYFHHDENVRNDFVNVGASINFRASERYSAFLSYGHTVWGENTHLIDHAVTVGAVRSF